MYIVYVAVRGTMNKMHYFRTFCTLLMLMLQVSSSGEVVTNKWGDCSSSATSSCPSETIATPSCTTTRGQCVFPFRYKVGSYEGLLLGVVSHTSDLILCVQ